ncbi:uncharacterized protein LOC124594420 [Schistocerca americana]|uniref:uncharacterized protein LOC124594420 n=1 Tax=Schistocerca americana TaxID=7009 RepID=UPI001F4F4BC3|nr:uncharacterized protein LOC124594420 [Schistocerca americana]
MRRAPRSVRPRPEDCRGAATAAADSSGLGVVAGPAASFLRRALASCDSAQRPPPSPSASRGSHSRASPHTLNLAGAAPAPALHLTITSALHTSTVGDAMPSSALPLLLLLHILTVAVSPSGHLHRKDSHRSKERLQQLSLRLHRSASAVELASVLAAHDPAAFCDKDMLRWFRRQAHAARSPEAMASFEDLKQKCRRIKVRRHPRRLLGPKRGASSKVSPEQLVSLHRRLTGLRCQPRRAMVTLNVTQHDAITFPSCVAVRRCAGCDCPGDGEHCAPTKTATVKRKVLSVTSRLLANGTLKESVHVKVIPVESHVECGCVCKVQPEDCSPWQWYDENSCSCQCRHAAAQAHCRGVRRWNHRRCLCECRSPPFCSTGFHVDPLSCRCVPDPDNNVV